MRFSTMTPPLLPGTNARVRGIFPYPLPRGLADGAEVSVEEIRETKCVVRDRKGTVWTVPAVAVDTGSMVWESGGWVPA